MTQIKTETVLKPAAKTGHYLRVGAIGLGLIGAGVSAAAAHADEIIVTATKRAENLTDVPIAISAFGAEQIERLNVDGLQDLSAFAPNLWMPPATEAGQNFITIRGVGQGISRSSRRAVSVYIDGIYLGADTATDIELADIERVEVLKGPQGTLYGRDSIAGAINITTKRPGAQAGAMVSLEAGNLGRRQVLARGSAPLAADKVWLSLSGLRRETAGYIDNAFTGKKAGAQDRLALGAQLYFTPTPSLTGRVVYGYQRRDDRPNTMGEAVTNPGSDLMPYTINLGTDETHDQTAHRIAANLEYGFANGYTLTSITGYTDVESSYIQDSDRLPDVITVNQFDSGVQSFSQELILASPQTEAFSYLAGAYYEQAENRFDPLFTTMGEGFLSRVFFLPADQHPPDVLDGQRIKTDTKTLAVFAHGNLRLTDKASLFGGLRYTDEQKTVDYSIFGETFALFGLPALREVTRISYDPLSWTFGGKYQIADGVNSYASISRGYRSPSVKDDFVGQADIDQQAGFFTDPEFITSYELGLKMDTGSVQTNLAAFYMDYTDIQVAVPDPQFSFLQALQNAAKAHIYGAELDINWQASEAIRLSANAGYLKTRYDEFAARPALEGTGFGTAPEWTLAMAADYEKSLSAAGLRGDLQLHADFTYRESPDDFVFETTSFVGEYGLLNASAAFVPDNGRWRLKLWAQNLTDVNDPEVNFHWGAGLGALLDNITVRYQQPRTYGFTLDVNFGG